MSTKELDQMVPFAPTAAWIASYQSQATNDLYAKATRYATMRARGVERAGGRIDDLYVRALVSDAFVDTFMGMLHWNPAESSLEAHVIGTIRSRSRHDRVQAQRYQHVPIDAFDHRRETARVMSEVEDSLAVHQDVSPDASDEVLACLRTLACDDQEVTQLLDAMGKGTCTKQQMLDATGMSARTHRNARTRIARLVRRMDVMEHARLGGGARRCGATTKGDTSKLSRSNSPDRIRRQRGRHVSVSTELRSKCPRAPHLESHTLHVGDGGLSMSARTDHRAHVIASVDLAGDGDLNHTLV